MTVTGNTHCNARVYVAGRHAHGVAMCGETMKVNAKGRHGDEEASVLPDRQLRGAGRQHETLYKPLTISKRRIQLTVQRDAFGQSFKAIQTIVVRVNRWRTRRTDHPDSEKIDKMRTP
jgi:hypothetical protein